MIRLIYSGSLVQHPKEDQVSEFLASARQHNQRKGICGVLVLMERDFLQVIEGPDDEVDGLFEQLLSETRRYSLILLSRQRIRQPIFGAWSLGFIKAESNRADPQQPETQQPEDQMLLEIQQIDPNDPTARHTLRIIREFIDGKWHHHLPGIRNPIIIRR